MKVLTNLLALMFLVASYGCGNAQNSADETAETFVPEKENPAPATGSDTTEALVKVITDYGTMTIRLYNSTPLHRDNFLKLVKQGYYDSLLFHRVIRDFMIQGGDPDSKKAAPGAMLGQGGPGYTVPAEIKADIYHKKGALAAARTGDAMNPTKASSGSQFYLVQGKVYPLSELTGMEQRFGIRFTEKQKELYSTVGGTPHLDGAYTVYGEVTEGLSVIDAIASVQTGAGDRPVKDVRMKMQIIRDYTPAQ
jgi:cyclophilin family peptidyl-prolyl cis-trans isomerase